MYQYKVGSSLKKKLVNILGIGFLLVFICGCGPEDKSQETDPLVGPVSLGRTIGLVCELAGYQSVPVEGYSLVLGLPGTGSSEAPASIREHILHELQVLDREKFLGEQYVGMTSAQIIESRTTALVKVTGLVPAGSPKGSRFDVQVRVPGRGTQTTSLQGGYLMRCGLQMVTRTQIVGRPTVLAAGPVFVNPFGRGKSRKIDPRGGVVIGGGYSLYDHDIRLIFEADYRMAMTIQKRINSRFQEPDSPEVAKGSRGMIKLRIPRAYRNKYQHFIALVQSLYLQDSPGYLDRKLSELSELVDSDECDYEGIALAWEAIGRTALVHLRRHYKDTSKPAAFYAAKAALNLGEKSAIDLLIEIAMNPQHKYRLDALDALTGAVDDAHCQATLLELLGSDNAQVRILAYDGVRKVVRDERLVSIRLPGGFKIDQLNCPGEKMVCVWADRDTRIVLFGKGIRCRKNIFIESPDGLLTLNVGPDDEQFTILRHIPGQAGFVTLYSDLELRKLIMTLAGPLDVNNPKASVGAGLSFSEIVGVLEQLSDAKAFPAQFKLHRLRD